MKQTIEIDVPDGYKAVYKEDTQKIEMVCATLPKSWREFCDMFPKKTGEYYISSNSHILDTGEGERLSSMHRNLLSNKKTAEAFLALMQLIQLRDCYRQGWKPDWEDDNMKKHCIFRRGGDIIRDWTIDEQRVLSFQSKEISEKFRKNFRELIEIAKELI